MRYHSAWTDTTSYQRVRETLTLANFYVTPKWVFGILIPNCTDNNYYVRKAGVDLHFLYLSCWYFDCNKKKVKCSRYRSGVAQRVGKGIALLFHDRGTRRG